ISVLLLGSLIAYLLDNSAFLLYFLSAGLIVTVWFTRYKIASKASLTLLLALFFVANNLTTVHLFARQKKFSDLVIYSDFTRTNKVDITTWRGNYWYYINNQNRLSTVDDFLYYEPLVHPAIVMNSSAKDILVLGGELGGALKEIVKYEKVNKVRIVPDDRMLIDKVRSNTFFDKVSSAAWTDPRIEIIEEDIFDYLSGSKAEYDVIIADLPDPSNLMNNQYYTQEFFELCVTLLNDKGVFVTQAGSPYFATKAYYSIVKTMKTAGFKTRPYHNQILTLGEWGWVIGTKDPYLIKEIGTLSFTKSKTRWINHEAMNMMLSFGKLNVDTTGTKINTIKEPVTHKYYTTGNWSF
ncbi:MAG: hypothetical protein WBA74_15780, partial [Cyclobacteriaceae bacterium]